MTNRSRIYPWFRKALVGGMCFDRDEEEDLPDLEKGRVKGHYRNVGGKRVYVKPHERQGEAQPETPATEGRRKKWKPKNPVEALLGPVPGDVLADEERGQLGLVREDVPSYKMPEASSDLPQDAIDALNQYAADSERWVARVKEEEGRDIHWKHLPVREDMYNIFRVAYPLMRQWHAERYPEMSEADLEGHGKQGAYLLATEWRNLHNVKVAQSRVDRGAPPMGGKDAWGSVGTITDDPELMGQIASQVLSRSSKSQGRSDLEKSRVKGHYRNVGGKRVYVKPHERQGEAQPQESKTGRQAPTQEGGTEYPPPPQAEGFVSLHRRGANQTVLSLTAPGENISVLFSYKTPVATTMGGKLYVTSQHHSRTTSKHINQWKAGHKGVEEVTVPPDWFSAIVRSSDLFITPIGDNETEVQLGSDPFRKVLFSYSTPVAARIGNTVYVTAKKHSPTTSRHVNSWARGMLTEEKPPEFFVNLLKETHKSMAEQAAGRHWFGTRIGYMSLGEPMEKSRVPVEGHWRTLADGKRVWVTGYERRQDYGSGLPSEELAIEGPPIVEVQNALIQEGSPEGTIIFLIQEADGTIGKLLSTTDGKQMIYYNPDTGVKVSNERDASLGEPRPGVDVVPDQWFHELFSSARRAKGHRGRVAQALMFLSARSKMTV